MLMLMLMMLDEPAGVLYTQGCYCQAEKQGSMLHNFVIGQQVLLACFAAASN